MLVGQFPHQFLEVPRRCGQHRVDRGRRAPPQVVLLHSVVVLEVPDERLYGGSAPERMALPPALGGRVALLGNARSQYHHPLYRFLATAAAVIGQPLREFYAVGLHLLQQGLYRVAVVRVPAERLYRHDDLLHRRAHDAYLVPELVRHRCLALGDACRVGLVEAVDFVPVAAALGEDALVQRQKFTVALQSLGRQTALQLADNAAGYGPQLAEG